MVKMNKVAAMVATGALAMGISASMAFAAIPSPSVASIIEGQTVATITRADGTEVAGDFQVSDKVADVLSALGLTEATAANAAPATAEKIAAAIKDLMIIPAPADEVRDAILDEAIQDLLDAAEDAIEANGDDASAYVDALIAKAVEGLSAEDAERLQGILEQRFAAVDPDGTAVLLGNPRIIIVPEALNPGEGGKITVSGLEFPGTTEDTKLFLSLQYTDAEGQSQLEVVVPEGEKDAQGDLQYTFDLPGGPTYFVMTPMGQPIAE